MGRTKRARLLLLSIIAAGFATAVMGTNVLADTGGPGVTCVAHAT